MCPDRPAVCLRTLFSLGEHEIAMIHDVDTTLRTILEREVIAGGDADVSFDAPTRDWAARQNKPTVNAFLYDVREDMSRREAGPKAVRDASGKIVGRRAPTRRFRLSYLLTAWTQRPEDEHRLLSQLLSTFLAFDEIDEEDLVGSLADADVPTLITLALPPPQDRSLSDVWSALGGELKPSLDLVVVAPLEAGRRYETGPPVLEQPRIGVADLEFSNDPEDVHEERSKRAGVAHPVPATAAEDGGELLQVGEDQAPGRTFVVRQKS